MCLLLRVMNKFPWPFVCLLVLNIVVAASAVAAVNIYVYVYMFQVRSGPVYLVQFLVMSAEERG